MTQQECHHRLRRTFDELRAARYALGRADVHHIRDYRNMLVHSRASQVDPLTVEECLSRLGKYIAYFPQDW